MKYPILILVLSGLFASSSLFAQECPDQQPQEDYSRVEIETLLDAVSKKSGHSFLLDARVSPRIRTGLVEVDDVTYPMLLSILRNNGLAAVTVDGVTSVIPSATVRQYPLPVIYEADDSILDGEWVSWIIKVETARAVMMVPIMRPLLPQQGHLSAHPDSNSLMLVDRYGNAKRVVEMVQKLDAESTPQQDSN